MNNVFSCETVDRGCFAFAPLVVSNLVCQRTSQLGESACHMPISYRLFFWKLPPPACPGTTCIMYLRILRGALFHLQSTPAPGRRRTHPLLNLPSVCTSYLVPAIPTSPHKSTLRPMLANHFILRAQVAPISTSPLPATLCPLYLFTYVYLLLPIYLITKATR